MHSSNRASVTSRLCSTAIATLIIISVAQANAQTVEEHDQPSATTRPELVVHAFGSVEWLASERPETPNSFTLGQFDLFVTGAINDRVSVLAEVVLEASAANTRVVTDLERLQLTYRLDDHLNLSAGRFHTGIGYYNAAFHHGAYFEIPIGRPRIFAFEDEGGVLPVHEVGVSARGTVPKTASALRYVAEVGNGRRWTELEDEEALDQNDAKSTNIGVSVAPERWKGLEVGGSFYRDEIPLAPAESLAHRIAAVYGIYRTPSTEVMAEWLQLSYRDGGNGTSETRGGYLQASRAFGRLRPYYRYDRLDIPTNTPLIGSFGSSKTHLLGIRVDPAEWIGLKAQYERFNEDGETGNGAHVQLVFVF